MGFKEESLFLKAGIVRKLEENGNRAIITHYSQFVNIEIILPMEECLLQF